MPSVTPPLFLFDIDGTMLVTGGSGYRSFLRACSEVVGIDGPIDGIHMAGKLDRGIFQQIVDTYRLETTAEEADRHWITFRRRYVELLEIESLDTSDWVLLPGVREVVEHTASLGKLALLTGNVREGQSLKSARSACRSISPPVVSANRISTAASWPARLSATPANILASSSRRIKPMYWAIRSTISAPPGLSGRMPWQLPPEP